MVGRPNRERRRIWADQRPRHRRHRGVHWRLAAASTRHRSRLWNHRRGYQRHGWRGAAACGSQACSRRRPLGRRRRRLAKRLAQALVAIAGGYGLTPAAIGKRARTAWRTRTRGPGRWRKARRKRRAQCLAIGHAKATSGVPTRTMGGHLASAAADGLSNGRPLACSGWRVPGAPAAFRGGGSFGGGAQPIQERGKPSDQVFFANGLIAWPPLLCDSL